MPRAIEKWTPLQDYESLYAISSRGRIKNLRTQKVLKGKKSKNGYRRVNLSRDGQSRTFTVHCLVAAHFIPNPENFQEVNHINENKLDNRVENLEWCDRKYNVNFGSRTERQREKMSKPVIQLSMNGSEISRFPSMAKADAETGIAHSSISACCRGIRKSAGGFMWKFQRRCAREQQKARQ